MDWFSIFAVGGVLCALLKFCFNQDEDEREEILEEEHVEVPAPTEYHEQAILALYNNIPRPLQKVKLLHEYLRNYESLERLKFCLIATPMCLYEKHILMDSSGSRYQNAINAIGLSMDRPNIQVKNTVFEDPEYFYLFPEIDIMISNVPTKVYQVELHRNSDEVCCYGKKWAIFSGEPPFHFFKESLRIRIPPPQYY